jgi:hypothetical protein
MPPFCSFRKHSEKKEVSLRNPHTMRLTFFAWQYSFSVTSPVLYSRMGELPAAKNYGYIISQQTQTRQNYFYETTHNSAILPNPAMVR